jgi:hypothetical protein
MRGDRSNAQMTPWFPANVKPVHAGVYEIKIRYEDRSTYCYWGGDRWGFFAHRPDVAELLCNAFADTASQAKIWRGFTERQS